MKAHNNRDFYLADRCVNADFCFDFDHGEPQTWHDPGCPASIELIELDLCSVDGVDIAKVAKAELLAMLELPQDSSEENDKLCNLLKERIFEKAEQDNDFLDSALSDILERESENDYGDY